MAATRLEDLLQAQQDLKKKDEQQRVESISVEDFRQMSKELSDSKDSRTTKSIIKKGMIDKTGDGLNANVIKMAQTLKDTTRQKGNVIGPAMSNTTPATKPGQLASPENDRLAAASKEGASKYVNTENTQKGGFAFLKDELKKLGTLEGYFKTGEASEGFFGNMVKRKANKIAAEYWKGKWQEQQEVFKKQAANEGKTAATPVNPVSTPASIAAELSTNETEAEAMRASSEQLSVLNAIELNTRGFKEALSGISKGAASAVAPESGGIGIGDVIGGGLKRAGGAIMKGAKGLGSAMVKNPKLLGKLGSIAAVATGGYTAYKGFNGAEEQKESSIAEVDQAVAEGKITPVEASTMKAKVTDESNVAKGTAVGEGTGMAAGGIAGMKIGATIGTMIGGPVGTIAGGAIGGAVGAAAGSTLGKKVGGSIISGYQSVRNFFGGSSAAAAEPRSPAAAGDDDLSRLNERLVKIQMRDKLPADERAARIRDNSANAPTPQSADAIYGRSGENAAAATRPAPAPSAPVVINAPTNVSNTSNMAVKSPVRNTESSYRSYERSKFAAV